MTLHKQEKQVLKKLLYKALAILIPVTSVAFILSITAFLILLARGYTINFKKQQLEKTGVVNLITHPTGAFVWLNSEPYGKTNKALPNIKVGKYQLQLVKDGYFTFKHNIVVRHPLVTTIKTFLVSKREPEAVDKVDTQDKLFTTEKGLYILSPKLQDNKDTSNAVTKVAQKITSTEPSKTVSNGMDKAKTVLYKVSVSDNVLSKPKYNRKKVGQIPDIQGYTLTKLQEISGGKGLLLIFTVKSTKTLHKITDNKYKVYVLYDVNNSASFVLDRYLSEKINKGWRMQPTNQEFVLLTNKSQVILYGVQDNSKRILFESLNSGSYKIAFDDNNIFVIVNNTVMQFGFDGVKHKEFIIPGAVVTGKINNVVALKSKKNIQLLIFTKDNILLIGDFYSKKFKQVTSSATQFKGKGIKDNSMHTYKIYHTVGETHDIILLPRLDITSAFINEEHDFIVFSTKNNVFRFDYNKEKFDLQTTLGMHELMSGKDLHLIGPILDFNYVIIGDKQNNIYCSSVLGENNYQIGNGTDITSYNDNSLVYRHNKDLLMKVLNSSDIIH